MKKLLEQRVEEHLETTKQVVKSCKNCRNHTGVFAYCPGCKDFSNWQPKEKLK